MDIIEKVTQILGENGIEIDESGALLNVDSLGLISTIVSIEEEFNVEVPDEYLGLGKFDTIMDFIRLIDYLIQET